MYGRVFLVLALIAGLYPSVAPAADGKMGGPPQFHQRHFTIDCDAGDTLASAVTDPAHELTLDFTGTCSEDVVIERDHVLLGSDGSGVIEGSVTLRGASDVTLEGFTVTAGRGVRITEGSAAVLRDLESSDNPFGLGIRVEMSSTATLTDVVAERNLFANIASINNGNVFLLGSVTANEASSTGIFVSGASELDSRATSLIADGNGFAGVAVQSGASARFSNLSSSNNGVVGMALVGGFAFVGGGTLSGHLYGVDMVNGSTAEVNGLTVNDGGVAAQAGSSLRASSLTVTGAPHPDSGAGIFVQSSHLTLFGGTVDGSLRLAQAARADFGFTPITLGGGLSCDPTAVAFGGQSCPP